MPSLVVEDAQADDLLGQLPRVVGRVVGRDAQQHDEPLADLTADFPVHGDLGLADSLHAGSHRGCLFKEGTRRDTSMPTIESREGSSTVNRVPLPGGEVKMILARLAVR